MLESLGSQMGDKKKKKLLRCYYSSCSIPIIRISHWLVGHEGILVNKLNSEYDFSIKFTKIYHATFNQNKS